MKCGRAMVIISKHGYKIELFCLFVILSPQTKMKSYSWLKNSKLYKSIHENDGDGEEEDEDDITPHVKYLCNPVINGPADVAHILGAIQYWDVNEIPSNILLYFATHTISLDIINFNIEKEWLNLFAALEKLYNDSSRHSSEFNPCIRLDMYKNPCVRLDIYKMIMTTKRQTSTMIEILVEMACRTGNLDCLQYIWGAYVLPEDPTQKIQSCSYGNINVREACVWSLGHINCFKYVWKQQFLYHNEYDRLMAMAANGDHFEELQYLLQQSEYLFGSYSTTKSCNVAANAGHLRCLKILHEKGAVLSIGIMHSAMHSGNIDCVKYMHRFGGINDIASSVWHWPYMSTNNNCVPNNSSIDCIKYVLEYVIDSHEIAKRFADNADSVTITFGKYYLRTAAVCGSIQTLQLAKKYGCQLNNYYGLCKAAAHNGHLECLKFLHQNGCQIDSAVLSAAAENNHMTCLKYVQDCM